MIGWKTIGWIEYLDDLTSRMRHALLLQERATRKMVDVLEVHAYALGTAGRKMIEDIKAIRELLDESEKLLEDE